ncbi:M4 family peptidase, partial [Streptomyces griseofuscus]
MHPTRLTAALAALTLTAGLAGTLVSTAAAAAEGGSAPAARHLSLLRTGALEVNLSPAQHKALIQSAQDKTTDTARTLGLGAKEKL